MPRLVESANSAINKMAGAELRKIAAILGPGRPLGESGVEEEDNDD